MSDMGFSTPPPPPPPPDGAGGGGPSLPQRDLGSILSTAFEIYKANASNLLLIVAVVVVPLTFISAFITGVVFAPDEVTRFGETINERTLIVALIVGFIGIVIAVIINAVLQAALLRGAALASLGEPVDIDASYKWGFARFGSVLLISLLVGLAVLGGLILLIIPGIIFMIMFSVSIPALVVENRRGTDAMSRSWNLVKGHFWHALGVLVVALIITAVISGIISAIGGALGDNWLIAWIFEALAQIVVAPFSALVSVLLYLDLRARTESLSAGTLRAELARNPA